MSKRYYPCFDGKEGFEERYVVMDSDARAPVSGRMSYHEANNQAHARNEGTFSLFTPDYACVLAGGAGE